MLSFCGLSGAPVDVCLPSPCPWAVVDAAPILNLGERIFDLPFLGVGRDNEQCAARRWIHVEHLAKAVDSVVVLAGEIEDRRAVGPDDYRQRLKLLRALAFNFSFGEASLEGQ